MPRDNHSRQRQNRSRSRSRRRQDSQERERSRGRGYDRNDSQRKTNDEVERRRRRQSSTSSSSSSSNSSSSENSADLASSNSAKLLKTLENRRLLETNARKRAKNELKAKETPEEKRARRLMEKQAKEQRRRERMGWDNEYQHYSNEDNPFGDSNLTSTFRWGKKLEKEGLLNVPTKAVEVLSLQKQLENKRELEKVKKRRMERELERQARDDEMLQQQRNKEAVQFREWQRQEDQFHLEQARLRSEIRIRDGRAKPIDLLAQYVSSAKLEDAIEMQMHEPYALLNGLEIDDLEDLLVDIKVYVELEKDKNIEFWNDMVIIVEDELQKQRRRQKESAGDIMNRRDGIHQSVVKDVADIFRGKNATQLDEMRTRIETKISQRAEGVDISYWESLLSQLKAHMARARLRDRHQDILREKLLILKKERDDNTIVENVMAVNTTEATNCQTKPEVESESTAVIETKVEDPSSPQNSERSASPLIDLLQMAQDLYNSSGYSPAYVQAKELDDGIEVLSGDEDDRLTYEQRVKTLKRKQEQDICNLTPQERRMFAEARKSMQGDEAEFSVETPVEAPAQMATDKYRPRKPRYFNRVHTGFEWNKYNQTHYDMDNPPPKIVQGYKFNIFYPDLMDKSLTPQYFLIPCEDNPDFAVLRFHTGPPYEDIAFKIVNREWEFSYKRGFRCQFQNNIFQLWFHFKRYRYRR